MPKKQQGFLASTNMKLLFTADVHIKLGQKNVPVDWSLNRYNLLWQQLQTHQSQADVFVVGGDVFDKLPSMAELEVFFDFVSSCMVTTYIYTGNHEMLKKDTSFLTNLKQVVNRVNPLVTILDTCTTICEGTVDVIPYNYIKTFDPAQFTNKVLLTHVRGNIPPHVTSEVPLEKFAAWHTVLAGDLHSYENCQANILYPGSPVTTSFHRNVVDTGVILFDTATHEHSWIKLELPQLLKQTVKVGDPTPATTYHHTIYEVEGNLAELAKLADNELIDKKVAKKATDAALILDSEMSLQQEVREYLTYIMELPDETIKTVLQELQNHESKLKD